MLTLQISLYAISTCLCLFTGMLLWQKDLAFPKRYFLAFLLLRGMSSGFEWMMANPETPYKGFWLLSIMSIALLLAPCLWLFARELTGAKTKFTLQGLFSQGFPIFLGILLLLPLATSIHSGTDFANLITPLSQQYTTVVLGSMLLMAGVFLVQSSYYSVKCANLIKHRLLQNRNLFAQTSESGVNVLRVLLMVVIANFMTNALRVLYCWALDDISAINLMFAGLQVALIVYLCFAVVTHSLDLGQDNQSARNKLYAVASSEVEEQRIKYKNSALDNERRTAILNKIEVLFNQEKMYRDSRLNLELLCKELRDLPYVVSQAINESEYKNFYALVNQYRIEEAQKLLVADNAKSILEIAFEVGYNSKSTFNTAFKKQNGMSPSEFKKEFVKRFNEKALRY